MTTARPIPPAPTPRKTPPGRLELLRALRDNPITAFTEEDYRAPIVVRPTVLGDIALVSDPASVRHVLVDNAANYRRDFYQWRMLKPGLGIGLLTAEGEDWRRQRRLLSSLFTPRAIARFATGMAEGAAALVARWRKLPDGAVLDVSAEMARLTLDVLSRTAFGGRGGPELDEVPAAVTGYIETVGQLDPMDALQAPEWAPRWGVWRAKRSIAVFDKVAASIADRAKRPSSDAENPSLVEALEAGGGSREDILSNIRTFLFAGYESTSISLAWTLMLLGLDPHWQDLVEAEADAVLAAPPPIDALAAALPHTRAVVEEALRLYPPVATISRQALGPDTLLGRSIRPGAVVVVSPWVSHRHRRLWGDDADAFDPARFMPGRREAIDRYAFLPFGVGPRTCIGSVFATQEAVIALATIAREFRLSIDPARAPQPRLRMTLRPAGGLRMSLTRRGRGPATLSA